MIELIPGFPDNVIALAGRGRVTRDDYLDVFVPAIEGAFGTHRKLRVYYELGNGFAGMDAGAMWEDLKIGMRHYSQWERVAVVSDVGWVGSVVDMLGGMVPGEVRAYPVLQAGEARAWIVAP